MARPQVASVEPDVVLAEAGGEGGVVEDFLVEAADLQPDLAGLRVPVQRDEAVQLLHALRLGLDGGNLLVSLGLLALGSNRLPWPEAQGRERQQCDHQAH